jgi:hypothetical protein
MDRMPPDPFKPRHTWVTGVMTSLGVIGAPLGVLGLAILGTSFDLVERTSVIVSFFAFLGLALALISIRHVRPLGVGMLLGTLATAGILVIAISNSSA